MTTGLRNIPQIEGLTINPTGDTSEWIGSSSSKSGEQLTGKVLVLGSGETGMNALPIDELITNLFDA